MAVELSADLPQTDSDTKDFFGYAPFAKTLANTIVNYRERDPLVLGLYGAWGSGKSTVLNFIRHYLNELPEKERPIITDFNPWWFSGKENLTRSFLMQLQAIFKEDSYLEKAAGLVGELSESVGGYIDTLGLTAGWGEKFGQILKILFNRAPKGIPQIKEKISDLLKKLQPTYRYYGR